MTTSQKASAATSSNSNNSSSRTKNRLDYLATMSSDDDSDDEFLRRYAGRPTFRKKKTVAAADEDGAVPSADPLTQSSAEETRSPGSPMATTTKTKKKTLTAEQIEQKAQTFVQGLNLAVVKDVCDMRNVGWRKTTTTTTYTNSDGHTHSKKGRRTTVYYPCIRLPLQESRLLFDKGLGKNKCGVRFLGTQWKSALEWEQVVPTTFYSLHRAKGEGRRIIVSEGQAAAAEQQQEEEEELNLLEIDDEKCLKLFLEHAFGPEPSVEKRIDELVIQMSWDKVRENKLAKEAEQRKEEEKIAKIAADVKKAATNKPLTPFKTTKDSDDDDDGDDGDNVRLFSPGSKQKKIRLRPGDLIQYYLPLRVFGNPDVLTQSTIEGINAKKAIPLNLASGDFLERDHKVRRLARWHRGVLIKEPDSGYIDVGDYELRTAGTMDLVGFKERVNRIKGTRQNHANSMDKFWQDGADEEENATVDQDEKTNGAKDDATAKTPKEVPTIPKDDREADPTTQQDCEPTWRKRLLSLLQETEENMKKKRRFTPRITPDEFQMVIKTWSLLQDRVGPSHGMIPDEAAKILVDELDDDISEMRIKALLCGDPQNALSERSKLEILAALKIWLDQQQTAKAE